VQQQIVQAAIAVAGYPPEGSHVIIPGGDTQITVAPAGLKVTSTTQTEASLSWNPVAGAAGYRIYRSGVSEVVGVANSTTGKVGGLQPNTSYGFQVAAFTGSGQIGPKSASATGKTKAVTLKAPTARISSIAATAATVSWTKIPGATSYRIYVNEIPHGTADGGLSSYRITKLSKKTKYRVTVRADTTNQLPGPESKPVYFTTKSK
jgi:chitodextrinase